MWEILAEIIIRYWPYLLLAFALGAVAGWVAAERTSVPENQA
jgi:hypothetical protein